MFLDCFSLVILCLGLMLVFYGFIYIHDVPHKLTKKWNRLLVTTALAIACTCACAQEDISRTATIPSELCVQSDAAAQLNWLQSRLPLTQWRGKVSIDGIRVHFANPSREQSLLSFTAFDQLIPAASVTSHLFRTQMVTPGPGLPVVCVMDDTPARRKAQPFMGPRGCSVPGTVLMQWSKSEDGASIPVLKVKLLDPLTARQPLAADFTAPFAWQTLGEDDTKERRRAGLFDPFAQLDSTALITPQPVVTNKIPVIFVHGLDSLPITWSDVANELQADPFVRTKFQFWFFRYPTGLPVPLSAVLLRENLQRIQRQFNPAGRNKLLNNNIIVGHSMGGILSRIMVTDSGDCIWSRLSPLIGQLSPHEFGDGSLLRNALQFSHQRYITRAVFIATPHGGSSAAGGFLGRIASGMVKRPDLLSTMQLPTSIDSLTPGNPFVQSLQALPIKVPFHSIVAANQNDSTGLESTTDGVVPYWSSHLEGAQSELIVQSGHSVHHTPQAIHELTRIMITHLRTIPR